jgi:hypothetical protein
LRDDPAIRSLVVDDHGVAVVVALALAAETGPQRVGRHRTEDDVLGRLVEHRKTGVDDLHVLRSPDRPDRVRRRRIDRERAAWATEAFADAVDAGLERRRQRTTSRRILQGAIDLAGRGEGQWQAVFVAFVPALIAIGLRNRVTQR